MKRNGAFIPFILSDLKKLMKLCHMTVARLLSECKKEFSSAFQQMRCFFAFLFIRATNKQREQCLQINQYLRTLSHYQSTVY